MRRLDTMGLLVGLLGVAGCSDDFDRVSEVKTVRVLGVRKTPAYPAPGQSVHHTILWHDGRPSSTRPVQITWLAGCDNPPGDQFSGCASALGEAAAALDAGGDARVGHGDTFDWTIADDIIESRPAPVDPRQPPYGTSFVFFAACAGRLGLDPAASVPLGCFDEQDRRLGADDFVLGYTTNFAYDDLDNALPRVLGFRVAGHDVAVDCLDEDCVTPVDEPPIDCASGDRRCVARCADDGDEELCPPIRIQPIVDPVSVEEDPVASAAKQTKTYEQVWIDYFADGGFIGEQLTLFSGADSGPREDYKSTFYAPAKTGPVRLWAVVKDNRGGVSWVRLRLQVR